MSARNTLVIIIISGVILGIASIGRASGWDGQRKGFIFGAGLGPGFTTFSRANGDISRENGASLGYEWKIGYAFSNLVSSYFTHRGSFFSATGEDNEKVTVTSDLFGVGASCFFRPGAPSVFIAGGIGMTAWRTPFITEDNDRHGGGIFLGGGYEFSRHFSVEFGAFGGIAVSPPEEEADISYETTTLMITINALGY